MNKMDESNSVIDIKCKAIPIISQSHNPGEYYVDNYWNFYQDYCKKYKEILEKSKGGK